MRVGFIVLTALLALPGLALAEKKIAFVNPVQAISQTEEVQASQMELQGSFNDERQKLQRLQQEVQQIQQKLQQEGAELDETEKKNLQNERESKMIEARQLSQLLQKRMQGEEQEIMETMRPKVMEAVEEIADEEGYDLVLNIQAVMYAKEGMDITAQVVEKLNEAE